MDRRFVAAQHRQVLPAHLPAWQNGQWKTEPPQRDREERGRDRRPAKLRWMECVCGCGRGLTGKLTQRNFVAASIALELLAWDKNRASPTPGPDGREGLIARGADCYQRLLYALHDEGAGDPDVDCSAWLKESAEMRRGLEDMSRWRLLGQEPPKLSKADMEQLDRKHPETSFTGRVAAPTAEREASGSVGGSGTGGGEDDLVDRLERLRALHAEGVLTDEEFAAAKARLLGRD